MSRARNPPRRTTAETGGKAAPTVATTAANGNNEPTLGPIPQLPVYVFNQTTITGLAAADRERAQRGWMERGGLRQLAWVGSGGHRLLLPGPA